MVNRHILIPAIGIGVISFVRAVTQKTGITPVLVGTYALLLVLSLLDMFGGPVGDIAGAIAWLAFIGVLLLYGGTLLQAIQLWVASANTANSAGSTTGGGGGGSKGGVK